MNGTTDAELHFMLGEVVDDVVSTAKRPCSRSSLVTTRVSPARRAASASRGPGRARFTGQALIGERLLESDTESGEGVLLGREVLVVGGDARVANEHAGQASGVRRLAPLHRAFSRAGLPGIGPLQNSGHRL